MMGARYARPALRRLLSSNAAPNRVSKRITEPKSQGASQAMLYATGLKEEDMSKAQVGIASVWYEGNVRACEPTRAGLAARSVVSASAWLWRMACARANGWDDGRAACDPLPPRAARALRRGPCCAQPCNMHLLDLAAKVKEGVTGEGLVGFRFNTIGVSDGISMGTDGMSYSLQSRDLIADSIETVMSAQWYDGGVSIAGCDKNMPVRARAVWVDDGPSCAARSAPERAPPRRSRAPHQCTRSDRPRALRAARRRGA